MRWWLKPIALALFTAAAIFFVCLWVCSHWTFDRLSLPLGHQRTLMVISYRGSLTTTLIRLTIPEIWRDSGRSHPVGTRSPEMIWPRELVLGFGWAYNELMPNIPNSPSNSVRINRLGITGRSWHHGGSGAMLPVWFLLVVLLTFAKLPWRPFKFSQRTLLAITILAAVLLTIFSLASRTPEVQWENGTLVTE